MLLSRRRPNLENFSIEASLSAGGDEGGGRGAGGEERGKGIVKGRSARGRWERRKRGGIGRSGRKEGGREGKANSSKVEKWSGFLSLADGHVVGRVFDCAVDWSMEQLSGGLGQLDVVAEVAQMLADFPLLRRKRLSYIPLFLLSLHLLKPTLSDLESSSTKKTFKNFVHPSTGWRATLCKNLSSPFLRMSFRSWPAYTRIVHT